jgi:NAD(P)-dependent dehydrogenase (short-subunit alcohol dehydrogenase family)
MEKFACVTGADRGLGYELVRQLLDNGYTVFAGRYMKDWPWLEELQKHHSESLYLVELDISKDDSVKAASRYIAERTDKLDILINNAAIAEGAENRKTLFDELDFAWMQHVFNVNTLGTLRVTNTLVPLVMKSSSKLIVNISSEAGSIARSHREGWFAYCMSKSALNMQSSIVHNNVKKLGGQVLVIHPGWMKTYMGGKVAEDAEFPPEKSASDIMGIIKDHEKYKGDQPTYIDHLGNEWPW